MPGRGMRRPAVIVVVSSGIGVSLGLGRQMPGRGMRRTAALLVVFSGSGLILAGRGRVSHGA